MVSNTTTIQKSMGIEDIAISEPMVGALSNWSNMYVNKASWLVDGEVFSLNLPAAVAGEIARVCTVEMNIKVDGSPRAEFIQKQLKKVLDSMRENVEYGAAKGGGVFKPFIDGENIAVDFVQADSFYPVAFNSEKRIVSCIFVDQIFQNNKIYTKLEFHSLELVVDEFGQTRNGYRIINKAFKSDTRERLGIEIPLTEVDEWADLQPEGVIKNVTRPLFGYFRYPLANNIDPGSPLGVACFARAIDLIQQADEIWSDLLWEFDSGKRAIYADPSAFDQDGSGKAILPNQRLYRQLNSTGDIGDNGKLFEEWSPTFREASILNALDAVLRKIEFNCGMDYGRLSNPESVEKTATEISASQQRFFSTIRDVQKALQDAADDLIYAIDVWATVGKIAPIGAYTVAYEFDDSIIVNKDAQFQQDLLVLDRTMSRVEFRMRNYSEDEATARKMIALVDAERQPVEFFPPSE